MRMTTMTTAIGKTTTTNLEFFRRSFVKQGLQNFRNIVTTDKTQAITQLTVH